MSPPMKNSILPDDQQQAAVRHRAAGKDRHVEAVFLVGAVDERPDNSRRLWIREPVRAEGDLIERRAPPSRSPSQTHKPRVTAQHADEFPLCRFAGPGLRSEPIPGPCSKALQALSSALDRASTVSRSASPCHALFVAMA